MRFFVRVELFNTIFGLEVQRVRTEFLKQLKYMLDSGKVVMSGDFADVRGGFFIVDVDTAEELVDLLGHTMFNNFHIETHPVVPFERLGEIFQKMSGE